jgi:hypothetical protein
MGFRMRKSMKIAPGVRLNVSKSGGGCIYWRKGRSILLHGKLEYADRETRTLVRAFVRQRPQDPVVQLLASVTRRRPGAEVHHGMMHFARRVCARAPRRRSVGSSHAKARAPGSRSSDDPPQLRAIDPAEFSAYVDSCLSPALSGLFCVPSHAQHLSADSSSPELGGARGAEVPAT